MSGDRYKIHHQNAIYFLTFTVIDWVDVFTRKEHQFIIVDSLNYCVKEKGLTLFAYVIMSNHIHLVAKAEENYRLSDIIRDFKKFTAKQIINNITEINESRREWMLNKFEYAGSRIKRNSTYKFWKDDNHAILLEPNEVEKIDQKLTKT